MGLSVTVYKDVNAKSPDLIKRFILHNPGIKANSRNSGGLKQFKKRNC